MTDEERTKVEQPPGEEAPDRGSPEEVAERRTHEYPTLGRAGDMTSDQESLARRPDQDEDEVDGNTEEGGTPPGTSTHGA